MPPVIKLEGIKYFLLPSGRTARAATINDVVLNARDFPLSPIVPSDGRPVEPDDIEFIMMLKEQA